MKKRDILLTIWDRINKTKSVNDPIIFFNPGNQFVEVDAGCSISRSTRILLILQDKTSFPPRNLHFSKESSYNECFDSQIYGPIGEADVGAV